MHRVIEQDVQADIITIISYNIKFETTISESCSYRKQNIMKIAHIYIYISVDISVATSQLYRNKNQKN